MFAPDSQHLFSRLIAKSGAIVNNWATKPREAIREISWQLVGRLNCTVAGAARMAEAGEEEEVKRAVQCIGRVPAFIVQAIQKFDEKNPPKQKVEME